jgi:hypothetical protein
MGGWRRALLGAVLVLAAIVLAPTVWAQDHPDDEGTTDGATAALAEDAEDERCENPTLNGPDCEGALAECDALGGTQNGCAALLECVLLTAIDDATYFPFDCWPDELGEPTAFLCRLIKCPGTPPSYCEIRDIRLLGWCKDGELIDPSTLPSTTTSTTTTTSSTTTTTTSSTTTTTSTIPSTTTTTAPTTTMSAPTTTSTTPTTIPAPTTTPTTTTPSTTTTSVPSTTAPPATVLGEDEPPPCDPNYAGACVPVAEGDTVNCADVQGSNFAVVGDDRYRLDEDDDGVACEVETVDISPVAVSSTGPGATGTQVAGTSAARSLAITGASAFGTLLLAMSLLVAGVVLTSSGARTARRADRRPGGYTFSSVDDLGLPTRYHVQGRPGRGRAPGRRQRR